MRDFGLGFLLAAPWAFGNIATGPFEEDNYQAGWMVLAHFAQESPRRRGAGSLSSPPCTGPFVATRGPNRPSSRLPGWDLQVRIHHVPFSPLAAVAFAAIQVLPITFLWLRRGLEVAIGFHVCLDLVRFLASYLAFRDVRFS